jgi:hypothetical protein
MDRFQWYFEGLADQVPGLVVTVWSAPNYMYQTGNLAAVMGLNGYCDPDFGEPFSAVPDAERRKKPPIPPYFM